MRRTRATDNVLVKPAYIDSETPGFHSAGPPATVLSYDTANMLQEELCAIVEELGGSLDDTGADDAQCANMLKHVRGIRSSNGSLTSASTLDSRAMVATDLSNVSENRSVALGAYVSTSRGIQSAVIATSSCTAGDNTGTSGCVIVAASSAMRAGGDNCMIIASRGEDYADNNADESAIIASHYSTGGVKLTGQNVAAIASQNAIIDGDRSMVGGGLGHVIDGTDSAILGGGNNTINTSAFNAAIVACSNSEIVNAANNSAILAGNTNSVDGAISSAVVAGNTNSVSADTSVVCGGEDNSIERPGCFIAASFGSEIPSSTTARNLAILASRHCDADQATTESDYTVMGGYAVTMDGPTWSIKSIGGVMHAAAFTVGGADTAEWRENKDSKAHLPGRILTRAGRGTKLATRGDRVQGVVSVNHHILGNDDSLGWAHKWARDAFGQVLYEEVEERTPIGPDPAALAESRARAADQAQAVRSREAQIKQRKAVLEASTKALEAATAKRGKASVAAAGIRTAIDALANRPKALRLLKPRIAEAKRANAALAEAVTALALRDEELAAAIEAHQQALAELTLAEAVACDALDVSDLDLADRVQVRQVRVRMLNPEWDRKQARKHVPREKRPDEWTKVGLLGEIRVAVDATVRADDFIVPGDVPGIGTRSATPGPGRPIECMEIVEPYDEALGYAVAVCEVG